MTVPVVFATATPDIFTGVPSQVTFNDGDETATITIQCSENMEMFKTYRAAITVPEEFTTQYADTIVNCPRAELTVVKEDYKPYKTGTYYSQFNEAEVANSVLEFSEILKCYRIKIDDEAMAHTFTFTVDDENNITINEPSISQGWEYPGYGDVYAQPAADKASMFDPDDNAYYFGFKYVIPAAGVGFNGSYYDAFVVSEQ